MSRRDDTVPMRHMLDYAREAASRVTGRSRTDLDTDRTLQLVLTRLIEIIGEAANRVSPGGRERHAEIPWGDIVAARNRMIHGYDTVDHDILWQIVTVELPALIAALERALPGHAS
jgi:uncharacterized protein with HEPN domain